MRQAVGAGGWGLYVENERMNSRVTETCRSTALHGRETMQELGCVINNYWGVEGISLQVRPSRSLPFFFLLVPPHCLKKKGTFWEIQESLT